MHILITGPLGYIGPLLIREIRATMPGARLTGVDSGFFAHCLTTRRAVPEARLNTLIFADVRDIDAEALRGVDAVIHLAAVSNDPMGNRFENVTAEINQQAGLRLAAMARAAGVKAFVFASSCSVYGAGSDTPRKENDTLNPLTAYARSKIGSEEGLRPLASEDMTITCLRFATACGFSDRLRLDLVLNDFVACALTSGEISILSDGTPWRPLIDVQDMARALCWAAQRPAAQGGAFLTVNTGSDIWNYQVVDLARAVAEAIPGTKIKIATDAPPDKRSYRVDFSLFRSLAPAHQPRIGLRKSIDRLAAGLRALDFSDAAFRQGPLMRLKTLEKHINDKDLGEDLRWV